MVVESLGYKSEGRDPAKKNLHVNLVYVRTRITMLVSTQKRHGAWHEKHEVGMVETGHLLQQTQFTCALRQTDTGFSGTAYLRPRHTLL